MIPETANRTRRHVATNHGRPLKEKLAKNSEAIESGVEDVPKWFMEVLSCEYMGKSVDWSIRLSSN